MDTTQTIDLAQVARELNLPISKVQRTLELLDEGNTVPFITRYRKDLTGALDDEQIRLIQIKVAKLRALAERKQTILKSIEAQGKLTPELAREIAQANSTKRLEDLYLPYKPKKQTLATLARQRGLEPLANQVLAGELTADQLEGRAAELVAQAPGLKSVSEVLHGVRHLLAEHFSERVELRDRLRKLIRQHGRLVVTRIESSEATRTAEQTSAPPTSAATDASAEHAGAATDGSSAPDESGGVDETGAKPRTAQDSLSPSADTGSAAAPGSDTPASPTATTDPAAEPPSSSPPDASADVSTAAPPSTEPPMVPPASDPAAGSAERPGGEAAVPEPAAQAGDAGDGDAPIDQHAPNEAPAAENSAQQPATIATDAAGGSDAVGSTAGGQAAVAQSAAASRPPRMSKAAAAAAKRATARSAKKQKKRQKLEAAFKDYFRFSESIGRLPPHRILAINRGERARILRVKLELDQEALFQAAVQLAVAPDHPQFELLTTCLRDALQRLIVPSLERETRRELTEWAEQHALEVFVRNLRKLLLQAPVRGRRVLAIDPGFRSGCKLIALDEFGNVLGHDLIHVVGREDRRAEGRSRLVQMIRQFKLSVVAIGNGTGCREAEQLVAEAMETQLADCDVAYVVVNEAGASVYSTSPLGREELPEHDPVMRSAISIGRRLLDPLSELVKINPANIGVGLYQHDVKAKHLRDSLDAVVESCVNFVGVDVNTASTALLRYVSGLNQLTARRVYEYRRQHGPFRNREQFQQVPGIGEATFVQAAGFLKIPDGDNPLDGTWIHPESYPIALLVLEKLGADVDVLRCCTTRPPRASEQPASDSASTAAPTAPEAASSEPLAASPSSKTAATGSATDTAAAASNTDVQEQPGDTVLAAAAVSPPEADAAQTDTTMQAAAQSTDAAISGDVAAPSSMTAPPGDGQSAPEFSASVQSEPSASDTAGTEAPAQSTPSETANSEAASAEAAAREAAAREAAMQEAARQRAEEQEQRLAKRAKLAQAAARVDVPQLAAELGVGELSLRDILSALTRPGRDPRDDLPAPVFRRGIMKLEDLKPQMELTGTVLNVVDFGAFVDIGLTETGLVHISRLADRYIRDPHEVVGVGDTLTVWVLEVDKERRRVSLTAVPPGTERRRPEASRPRPAQTAPQPAAAAAGSSSAPQKQRPRPQRPERGKKPPRPATGRTWTQRSKQPAQPLTQAMEEGKEPLRSFSDLLQFYEKKQQPPDATGKQT